MLYEVIYIHFELSICEAIYSRVHKSNVTSKDKYFAKYPIRSNEYYMETGILYSELCIQ